MGFYKIPNWNFRNKQVFFLPKDEKFEPLNFRCHYVKEHFCDGFSTPYVTSFCTLTCPVTQSAMSRCLYSFK